jgi:hypothetical protein
VQAIQFLQSKGGDKDDEKKTIGSFFGIGPDCGLYFAREAGVVKDLKK